MKNQYILTHDLGTTGDKAALFDVNLNPLFHFTEKYPIYYPKKGLAEQDALDWWEAVKKTTGKIIREGQIKPDEIRALVFDCQMNCTVPINRNGDPLMRSINWLDSRASSVTHKFTDGLFKISGYQASKLIMFLTITGGAPGVSGKDPISHIIWIKENEPKIYEKTYKFLSVKDFVIFKCTNNAVTSRDLGNTSWMMDTNPGKFMWSDRVLNKFDIDKAKLPDIKKSTEIAGELTDEAADELGLKPGIPVIVGSGDIAAAAIGSGAILNNQYHICLGTSNWIATHSSENKKDIHHYTGAICSAQEDYLVLSKQETGAVCLEWIKNQMFQDEIQKSKDDHDSIYTILDSHVKDTAVGAGNLLFLPWLFGERCPVNDASLRGGFINLSLEHTRADLLRAVYEGVAFNAKWALTYIEKLTGRAENLNIIGGGAYSDVWCQIIANVLERKINQMSDLNLGSAKGSAIIAMVGLGILKNFSDAVPIIKVNKSFVPEPESKQIYARLFDEYRIFYKKNKRMFANLNLTPNV